MLAEENMPRCIPPCCLCSVWQGFPCLRDIPGIHKSMEEDREVLEPSATPKGQLGQATAYGSAGQEYPRPTPLGAIFIPTGCRKSWTPGCSLRQRRVGAPTEKVSTCNTVYVLGFSPQQEELRALCFSLPPPREVPSLSHGTREEAGVQRG